MDNSVPQNPSNDSCCDIDQEEKQLISQLPKTKGWLGSSGLSLYQGFWCPSTIISNVISFQKHFKAHDRDIILASKPKSGTTWLKALLFSIVNRDKPKPTRESLLNSNPHELVPFFEFTLFANKTDPDLTHFPSPRLFSTHIPYGSLSGSIEDTSTKIVYLCRSPLDMIVSHWHFASEIERDKVQRCSAWTLEDFVSAYCQGQEIFGPFWDHMIGYWRQSFESPQRVYFVKYEDLKRDTKGHVTRLAEFVGSPFSPAEERRGVVEEIIEACSLRNLKELDVNKHGKFMPYFENKSYFRKGQVGDWVNHLSPSMVERLEKLVDEKLSPFGLTF